MFLETAPNTDATDIFISFHRGWLKKRNKGKLNRWLRRFCQLCYTSSRRQTELTYYEEEGAGTIKGVVHVSSIYHVACAFLQNFFMKSPPPRTHRCSISFENFQFDSALPPPRPKDDEKSRLETDNASPLSITGGESDGTFEVVLRGKSYEFDAGSRDGADEWMDMLVVNLMTRSLDSGDEPHET